MMPGFMSPSHFLVSYGAQLLVQVVSSFSAIANDYSKCMTAMTQINTERSHLVTSSGLIKLRCMSPSHFLVSYSAQLLDLVEFLLFSHSQ